MKNCILLILAIGYLKASSQNTIGLPKIDNFNNLEFHGGRQTWDIKQGKWGRMYFANNDGLLTYDGSYWKMYPQPNKSILRSIAIDDNRIYAGGQDEIGYYSPDEQGALQYHSLKNLIPVQSRKFTDVWDIEFFKGSVFFRSWDMIFEYKNQVIQSYHAIRGWQYMKSIGSKLFAQDKDRGLLEFVNGQWEPLCMPGSIPNFEITGLIPLKNDSLLISSLDNGLFIFYKGILTKKHTEADKLFIKSHIFSFEKINATELIAGTSSDGCIVINFAGQIIQKIAIQDGLQNNNILSVFLDRDKNLWTGLDNGISLIAYNSAIKYIKPDKDTELSGYSARVFDHQLYIATSYGAYSAPLSASSQDLSFSKANFAFIKNTEGQNWRLDEVNHQLLLGHHNGSYLIQNNEAIQLTHDAGIWLFLPTASISPSKTVLAGSYSGISILEFAGNNYFNNFESKGIYESFRFIAIDNNNDTWASHPYRGIYKLRFSSDNKSFTSQLFSDKDGLPSTLRNFVFRIKNRVVVATEKGVYEMDPAGKKFIPSPQLFNVFGPMAIQYLKEDEEGNVWFCTDKKIGVVHFSNSNNAYQIHYFPELTGKILAGFENINPFSKQNVFIGADNGIIHLNYEKYIANLPTLNILLAQAKAFGKTDSIIFGGHSNQLGNINYELSKDAIVKIPGSNNSLHFEFSSPAYSLQNNIEYSYQLIGYDNKWSTRSSKTEKEYTNLNNGSYTFKVRAIDNLGNVSKTISYRFVINPAWYQTLWAYLFYTLFVISIFYWVAKWQKKKLVLQQIKFEDEQKRLIYIHQLEVDQHEKEIVELQNEKLVNEMIYKKRELADASMHLVERTDALLKVKNELQHLYTKTGGNHDVKKAIQLVNDIEKTNSNWEQFATHFDEVNNDFLKKLKQLFPSLTNTDLKVCAYVQLNLASKEIAQLMNIAVRGVEISRYRLRKKLQLKSGESLNDFLHEIHNR
jgi:ligand-binding sensor domain-containing protein